MNVDNTQPPLLRNRKQTFQFGSHHRGDSPNTPIIVFLLDSSNHNTSQSKWESIPFSEENYLRHFKKMYEARGWTTFQCTTTQESGDSKNNGISDTQQAVRFTLAAIESQGLNQHPIFLHLLGHQSVSIYNEFTKAVWCESDDIFPIQGTIVDSAPSRTKGMLAIVKRAFPNVYFVVMLLLQLLAFLFPELISPPEDHDDFEQFCCNKCACPQLYLYSTSDHLVNPEDVEKAINIRQQAGVVIETKCWTDTEHVRHLFTHEQEYTALCHNFVATHLKV